MNPKVSIIIPFYNCSYVDQAIESALNQTYENIEIILVDDGSTTHLEKIEPFKEKMIYVRKENGGTATALNRGINTASGEYVTWLSSDDLFTSDKISKQLEFMLSHQADISFTNYDVFDKDNNILVFSGARKFSTMKELYEIMSTMNPINGGTVMTKKSIFQKVGYFNPNMRFTHDYCMWFRVLLHGYQMHFIDEPLSIYRVHNESSTQKNLPLIMGEIGTVIDYYVPQFKDKFKD